MKRVLLVCQMDPSVDSNFDQLIEHGFELVRRQDLAGYGSESELTEALAGAWGVIAGNEHYTQRVLESAPDLRWIARPGVGYDNIDVTTATRRGIGVFITPGTNHEAVADLTIGLMLATVRRIVFIDRTIRAGGWRIAGLLPGLHGSTVGIVGLGQIGRAVVRRLVGFECVVIATEPNPDLAFCAAHRLDIVPLEELLRRSDVVSLHVPLEGSTHHLIGPERLSEMQRHAILINTARGAVVDQRALVEALEAGQIGGAGLDVFETEPLPEGDRIASMDNVVLTSHVAAHTLEAMTAMIDATIEGILAVASGRPPYGSLNPSAFAAPPSGLPTEVYADGGR